MSKRKYSKKKKKEDFVRQVVVSIMLIVVLTIGGLVTQKDDKSVSTTTSTTITATEKSKRLFPSYEDLFESTTNVKDFGDIPEYSGKPYVVVNNNEPDFLKKDLTTKSYEKYGALDSQGRCTTCIACIGKNLMPTGERGSISSVKPTGWHSTRYDFIDGKNLYNRCHLIGYQLTGENANYNNLITGTRCLNVDGMLPFENEVGDYVRETNNHVLYRVTPVFVGDELVARGVHMEALSVEDNGKSMKFNVYCYNVQPNVKIDYATGDSSLA